MKIPNAVAIATLIGCVILIVLLLRAHHELALANAALASGKTAHAELTVRMGELESTVIEDALLKRLESGQGEALKLRGEVSALKQSLATAEKEVPAAARAMRSSASQPVVPKEPTTSDE